MLLDALYDIGEKGDNRLPEIARACVLALGAQLRTLKAQILNFDRLIMAWHRSNEASKRRLPPLWSPVSLIQRPSGQVATARNAEPVDPAIRTTHLCQCISNAGF